MSLEEKSKSELSEWLDSTQRESWQLELLFSAFVVFLLVAGLEPYHDLGDQLEKLRDGSNFFQFIILPYHFIRAAYYFLIAAVLMHVFLRGLWISTIGLRSVSDSIDWSHLNLHSTYDGFLKKQIKSFDHYIDKIESYCSIFFAFTFLMVFSLLGFTTYVLIAFICQTLIRFALDIPLFQGHPGFSIDDGVVIALFGIGIIYMIDFVSMGWLKRIKWFQKIYYPVYRVLGIITFARLYRPIYYNLIDHKLGKKLVFIIVPLSLATMALMSLRIYNHSYIPYDWPTSSKHTYLSGSYEDNESTITSLRPSIRSKIIGNNHIELFVPYSPTNHDETVEYICPDLKPGIFIGPKLRGAMSVGDIGNRESAPEEMLTCMKQLWRVSINDSTYSEVNFRYYKHPKRDQYGLLAIIPIHELDYQEHFIKIDRQRVYNDSLIWYEGRHLWFYKE